MKKHYFILSLLAMISFASCEKNESKTDNGKNVAAACADVPPTNEACLAQFNRWFYNSNSNTCELVSYSGCSEKGFETQAECVKCVNGN